MATLDPIIHGDLPPVGEAILIPKLVEPAPEFDGFNAHYVDSGTSALALALLAAKQLHPDVKHPEVIIPAYCCPDLVSAAVFAKIKPVVVDITPNQPTLCLSELKQNLSGNTIAVIAVNFLGIPERLKEIKNLLPAHCHLIEDNAQSYTPLTRPTELQGDFIITSFGRGKPVSLLGGGLCLINSTFTNRLQLSPYIHASSDDRLLTLKIRAYNLLIHPKFYWLANRNPLLNIGQTIYKPLKQITAIDSVRKHWLQANIHCYLRRARTIEKNLDETLAMQCLIHPIAQQNRDPLLRYPVLCEQRQNKDQLYKILNTKGLGASTMYGSSIDRIPGINSLVTLTSDNRHAARFAEALLTLPCHSRSNRLIKDISQALKLLTSR
ncbi:DegT/DnrJ/EryC1/StrS family aminotransferase [Oceanicoccus sp. KOV_DT_Chl]|uniref:DegT/DnrJ/EryC1/StrS family aminotransferase n=1 Tax=Oceanicoccus sp. KOV_DT_Chl TaxID=1904639 RepID=UPI000C7A9850|nr:DegT/DnrJ/EryC1/StrS family aminotransferase [Oceanicoccus sp. KOV_DT_Chl]